MPFFFLYSSGIFWGDRKWDYSTKENLKSFQVSHQYHSTGIYHIAIFYCSRPNIECINDMCCDSMYRRIEV